jgi:hypothetical protein
LDKKSYGIAYFFERSFKMVKEVVKVLPHPEVYREQCVPECKGCEKMYSDKKVGDVCMAYISPHIQWKHHIATEVKADGKFIKEDRIFHSNPCALANHIIHEEIPKGKKWVNPLKLSKRRNR